MVDDRPEPAPPIEVPDEVAGRLSVRIVPGLGRGPAAARNLGARLARTTWIAFLDDDVVVPEGWALALQRDLARAGDRVAGVQGRIRVPPPEGRRRTDWERSTAGLEEAEWATADMAYRAAALAAVDGFDERFPRAYREDADLALRVREAGWELGGGAAHRAPRAASRSVGERARAARQHRRRPDAPSAREGLAPPGGDRSRPAALARGDDGGGSGSAGRPGDAQHPSGGPRRRHLGGTHRGLHPAPHRARTEDAP